MSNPEFEKASQDVQSLAKRPNNETLLELYALYKQGTMGNVTGKKPGMLDLKGRKKYEAWESKKGMSSHEAQSAYILLVKSLLQA